MTNEIRMEVVEIIEEGQSLTRSEQQQQQGRSSLVHLRANHSSSNGSSSNNNVSTPMATFHERAINEVRSTSYKRRI